MNKLKRRQVILKRAVNKQYGEIHSDEVKQIIVNYASETNLLSDEFLVELLFIIEIGNIKLLDLIHEKNLVIKKILNVEAT
jgi:hypothetical protein